MHKVVARHTRVWNASDPSELMAKHAFKHKFLGRDAKTVYDFNILLFKLKGTIFDRTLLCVFHYEDGDKSDPGWGPWRVSDPLSGYRVAFGNTLQHAVENAYRRMYAKLSGYPMYRKYVLAALQVIAKTDPSKGEALQNQYDRMPDAVHLIVECRYDLHTSRTTFEYTEV
jgi:hypothetical protein